MSGGARVRSPRSAKSRQREADRRADRREDQRLGEHLPRQTETAGAEGRPDGELRVPGGAANQDQAGDVPAGDDEQHGDRDLEQERRLAHRPDDPVTQVLEAQGPAAVRRGVVHRQLAIADGQRGVHGCVVGPLADAY